MEQNEIRKTKLFLKLHVHVSGDFTPNLPTGHNCAQCQFILPETLRDFIEKLPSIEDSLLAVTKMAPVYIAGYVARRDDVIENTFQIYTEYGSYLDNLNRGKFQVTGDTVCQW